LFLSSYFLKFICYYVLQSTPGVTGAVMWDSGVVLAKFLEHAVDTGQLSLKGTRVVELGAGCGLAGYKFLTFLSSDLL
jgi:Lysine methyltransferase